MVCHAIAVAGFRESTMLREDRELTERAARIEALLDEIDSLPDPAVRGKVADVVQGLLAFYGEGLRRMLAIVERDGRTAGAHLLEAFARDELIAHLLLLHDLHPVDVETRVARALEEVRPYLQSHGGNVQLLGIEGGVARLPCVRAALRRSPRGPVPGSPGPVPGAHPAPRARRHSQSCLSAVSHQPGADS